MHTKKPSFHVHPTIVDKVVSYFSPQHGLARLRHRASLQFLESGGYVTSSSTKRSMRGWNSYSGNSDEDILPKLGTMRKDSRDLSMNTPLAVAPLVREVTNVVGWGLEFQSRIDREFLNLNDEVANAWERNVEREFRFWSSSKNCDASRTLTFNEIQAMCLYNTSLSGDVFVLLPYIKRAGSIYSLSLQVVEADMVSNPATLMETNQLSGGIEVDQHGAPIRYYVQKPSMSSFQLGYSVADSWVSIEAYGTRSGRPNILHLYHKLRPGQRRGVPILAPVIETLKQMSRLSEAELAASVINSFFTVFIKTNPVTGGLQEGFIPEDKVTDSSTNPTDEKLYEMGSGNIIELGNDGQDISLADPKRPNDAFEPFMLAMMKQVGAALEIPFEQLILHFSSSYSAARAALLEAWKFYRTRRRWLGVQLCTPVYQEFLAEAVALGRIAAPGFFSDPAIRAAWSGAMWVGPGQGQIDPLKETKASAMRIRSRLSDHETEYAAIHGEDWEKSMSRLGREKKFLEEKGIEDEESSSEEELNGEEAAMVEEQ